MVVLNPYVCTRPSGFGWPVTVRTVVYVAEPSRRVRIVKSTGKPAVPPPAAGVSVRGKRRTASRSVSAPRSISTQTGVAPMSAEVNSLLVQPFAPATLRSVPSVSRFRPQSAFSRLLLPVTGRPRARSSSRPVPVAVNVHVPGWTVK